LYFLWSQGRRWPPWSVWCRSRSPIGNGAGAPAAFAFAGETLLCFSVGYAVMSQRIVNTGGFYTYIARGLGKPLAGAGGLITAIAYNTTTVGLVGATGHFAQLIAASHGVHLPRELWAAMCIALIVFVRCDFAALYSPARRQWTAQQSSSSTRVICSKLCQAISVPRTGSDHGGAERPPKFHPLYSGAQ
jgi:hypothetical protein